ncbi:MAG: Ig-like domain-containing protein [Polyangiaceae bacterium]|nr:Ig-like domain-containing protein [Polyangiaceae bacterium]
MFLASKRDVETRGKRRWVMLASLPLAFALGSSGCWVAVVEGEGASCHVTSTTPSFGETSVNINTEIVIEYDRPIDFSTVDATGAFSLLGGETVTYTVFPEGETGVRVVPDKALRYWGEYALYFAGVTGKDETECEPAELAFKTLVPVSEPEPLRPTQVNDSAIVGDRLITVSPTGRRMQVYDISNGEAPVLKTEVMMDPTPVHIRVDKNRAYVASGPWGTAIYDVTNPEVPILLGVAGSPGQAIKTTTFEKDGKTYLVIADNVMGMRIADVTDPAGVVDIWSGGGQAGVLSVAYENGVLAAVDRQGAFQLYDVQNPAAPVLLSDNKTVGVPDTFGTAIPASDVAISGTTLVVSLGYAGFESFNISNPQSPVFVSHLLGPQGVCSANCADNLIDMQAFNGSIFAAAALSGGMRVNIGDGGQLIAGATLKAAGRINSIATDGKNTFIGGDAGLTVYTVSATTDTSPSYVEKNGWGAVQGAAVKDGYLYATSSSRGLETYSVSNPLAPLPLALTDSPGVERDVGLVGVAAIGNLVVVGDGRAGLSIFSAENPASPSLVANFQTSDGSGAVIPSADPNLVYLCVGNKGLGTYDISVPEAPKEISLLGDLNMLTGGCSDLELIGDRLYYSGGKGIAVLNVSVPSSPIIVSSYDFPGNDIVTSIASSPALPGRLFATTFVRDFEGYHDTKQRLSVFDISNPDALVLTYWSEDLGGARDVTARDDKLFVAATEQGILVFDASVPDVPVLEGAIATRGSARGLTLVGEALYVTKYGGGLGVVNLK